MNYLSLLIPFAYLGILLTSLATFSSLYRKRKARSSFPLSIPPIPNPESTDQNLPPAIQKNPSTCPPTSPPTRRGTCT